MHPAGVNYVNKQGTRSKKSWQECKSCKKKTRSLRWSNKLDGFVCYHCYIKEHPMIKGYSYNQITLEKALNRIYEVKTCINKKGYLKTSPISFPKCLAGCKFKIQLIENAENK